MTNVSHVYDAGSSFSCSLCLSLRTVWRASEASPHRPYAFCCFYLSECQDMAGVRFSAPTEERSAALQEGLITYTPCKRDSRTVEQAH